MVPVAFCCAAGSKDAFVVVPPKLPFESLEGQAPGLPGIRCLRVGCKLGLLARDMGMSRDFAGFGAEAEF